MEYSKSNYEIAKTEADKVDERIIDTLRSGRSFRVEAGAGSGKTFSLNKVIEWLQENQWQNYNKKMQRAICITYTNAAVDVITHRLLQNSFIKPSTIHTFSWNAIKQFQLTLIKLVEENKLIPEDTALESITTISYTRGVRYVEGNTLYLYHNDVIILFSKLLENEKFRKIFSLLYPIILIDEYQDSFKVIIEKFVEYFIRKDVKPQFGFFGDSWQTIYKSNNTCGLIEDEKLIVIPKSSNFRSAPKLVSFLNLLRPELPQLSAIDGYDGEIVVVHSNDFTGKRRTDSYFKDDLPINELELRLKSVETRFRDSFEKSDESLKILMITHKVLAAQQGYSKMLDLLGDGFKNEDDPVLRYFMNTIEPVFEALQTNNTKLLFESLGVKQYPIATKAHKQEWFVLKEKINKARKSTVAEMLKVTVDSGVIPTPPEVYEVFNKFSSSPNEVYRNGTVQNLANLNYSEFISGIEFLRPTAIYSTDHGVKGEEYDNVIFVIGRGWNNYNFEKYMPLDPRTMATEDLTSFERNRNLFYVCCSRARKRLMLFITTPFTGQFKAYIERLVDNQNIYSFSEYSNHKKGSDMAT